MNALISLAITPKTTADAAKLRLGLARLSARDPNLHVGTDDRRNDRRGISDQHLEIILLRVRGHDHGRHDPREVPAPPKFGVGINFTRCAGTRTAIAQKLKLIPTPQVRPHVFLYFETHSTSLDNEAGIASGWFDVDLSPRGEERARELGRRYADVALARVYSSDLKRAVRTAEIAFGGRVPIARDARLRECNYGDLTREPTAIVDAQRLNHISAPFPNGESYESCVARVASFLADGASGDAPILIVGHRATWYALEHLLRGRPLAEVIAAPWQWQPGWDYVRGPAARPGAPRDAPRGRD